MNALIITAALRLAIGVAPLEANELTALAGQKQWAEVLAKGQDVLPSQRTPAWREAIESAALAELARLQRAPKAHGAMPVVDAWLSRYASLAESPRVLEARRALAAKAWADCMADGVEVETCAGQLVTWSRAAPLSGVSLLEAAKQLSVPSHEARVSLVSEALRVEPTVVRCDDAQVGESLVAAAGHAASRRDVDAVVLGCGTKLGKPALARLLDTGEGLARFCPGLIKAGLGGVQRARCERGATP